MALGILMVVMSAVLPQIIVGIRGAAVADSMTAAKGIVEAQMEKMRNLPWHVAPSAELRIDVLDRYFPNLTAPSNTSFACLEADGSVRVPATTRTGYVSGTTRCAYEPLNGPFYRTVELVDPAGAGRLHPGHRHPVPHQRRADHDARRLRTRTGRHSRPRATTAATTRKDDPISAADRRDHHGVRHARRASAQADDGLHPDRRRPALPGAHHGDRGCDRHPDQRRHAGGPVGVGERRAGRPLRVPGATEHRQRHPGRGLRALVHRRSQGVVRRTGVHTADDTPAGRQQARRLADRHV